MHSGDIDAIAYDRPLLQEVIRMDSTSQFELLPIEFNPQFYAMGFNRSLSDSLKIELSTSILAISEGTDWKVALSEYGLVSN
jgi:ABC-type amino acid transport substrate-binding protein